MNLELPRTLVVLCPDWAVLAHGHRRDEPVAIAAGGRVVTASFAARDRGIFLGQRVLDAQALCHELVVHESDPRSEADAFGPVVEALASLTNDVAHCPGWVAFRTRGPARYFGGEAHLAQVVEEKLSKALGIAKSERPCWLLGIADGVFGATQAARLGQVWPSGATPARLSPLGLDVLDMPELSESLAHLGIRTLGAFGALPEGDVLARFGQEAARAHRLASGKEDPLFRPLPFVQSHAVKTHLEDPVTNAESAAFLGRSLAESLGHHLSEKGLSCSLLEVVVETTDGEVLRCLWGQDVAMSPNLIAERLRFQLEGWIAGRDRDGQSEHGQFELGITAIALVALETGPERARAIPLFGASPQNDERVARVLARLQGMLGGEAVLAPVLVGGRGPLERIRLVSIEDRSSLQDHGMNDANEAPWPGKLPAPNPALVPRDPLAAGLFDELDEAVGIDGRGALSGMPTSCVVAGGSVEAILGWSGPWPMEERWWDRPRRRRRARLQVLTATGRAYLFALEHGHWIVEGIYD